MSQEICGRAREPLEPGASPPGPLVDPAGHWAQARSPGGAGQPCGPSERSTSRQGVLVDTAGPRTRARVAQEIWRSREHSVQARVAWGNWSTTWALGPAHKSPGRACRPRRPSDQACISRESWSTLQALEHSPRSAGTFGQARRPSGMGLSLPGELVDNVGLRPERESHGSAGGNRGPSEKGASRSGELVDLACYRSWAREKWDSWSTPRTIGPWSESHGTDGRPRRSMDMNPSRQGVYSAPLAPVPEPE